jgi:acetoin:2,6-dichlorophenolindophenol oxidoreductase subunit alpha
MTLLTSLPSLAPSDLFQPLSPLHDDDLSLLLLIRHFEWALLDLFGQGKLNGTTHTCLGQEYIPVALRPLLTENDFIFSNHRGHGHYLARFQDPAGLLAEIMGRAGAVCSGVGGSQHIYRPNYLSTGIQGQSLPVAAGVAMHLKRRQTGGIAVVHIGDGTWGEGSVYEALNMAQLWQLPVLVVVENNEIAQSTGNQQQMAGTIAGRVRGFGIEYKQVDTIDVAAIRTQLRVTIQTMRQQPAPLVLEFKTHRLGPHSKGDDTRSPEIMAEISQWDWHRRYQQQFLEQFELIEKIIKADIKTLVQEVEARPLVVWTQR